MGSRVHGDRVYDYLGSTFMTWPEYIALIGFLGIIAIMLMDMFM